MAGDWMQAYIAALDVRDAREGAHKKYIDAYNKLADKTAAQEGAPAAALATTDRPDAKMRTRSPAQDSGPASNDILVRLRTDLAATQRSRTELQSQLSRLQAEMDALTAQSTASAQRITVLEREKRDLDRKLRDREEELRGKAQLVEHVHDEMVGLNLQLNMADEKAEKLTRDNEELVRRWMERMGQEADRMNVESQWS